MNVKMTFKNEKIKIVFDNENCLNKENIVTTITVPIEIPKRQLIDLIRKSDCFVIKKDLTK